MELEIDHVPKPEDDTKMAIRLLATLKHQEDVLCKKRRWILRRWPENVQKRRKLSFLTEMYVPESDLRDDKSILGIKSLIQRAVNALHANHQQDATFHTSLASSREFRLDKIQETSDLELVRMSPLLLVCLDMKALRTLLHALSGRHLSSKNRLSFEQEIRKEFANMSTPYDKGILAEPWLKVASILRNPSSWRHDIGLNFQGCKLFSQMPSSALAAAREAFAHVDKLPTRNLEEVHKMLMADGSMDLPVCLRRTQHSPGFTLKMVKKKVNKLLDSGKEVDLLPWRIERALQVVSLSARVLYGDDGGLTKLLRPLSPKQKLLEDEFIAAYTHLEKMELPDLIEVFRIFDDNPENLRRSKYHCIKQLQGVLTSSMHFIYVSTLPEPVARALSVINKTREDILGSRKVKSDLDMGIPKSEERVFDFGCSSVTEERKKEERIGAELEAVLGVSAQLQKMAWEYCEFFEKHGLRALSRLGSIYGRSSSQRLQVSLNETVPASTGTSLVDSESDHIGYVMGPSLGLSTMGAEVKLIGEMAQLKHVSSEVHNDIRHMDSEDFMQEVERMADDTAKVAYVLIGHLLNEMSLLRPMHLARCPVEYLQVHEEHMQVSGIPEGNIQLHKKFKL